MPVSAGWWNMARAVVGSPRLVLLDEPAAGLPDDETEHRPGVIKRIPSETGAVVILVDHDMSLESAGGTDGRRPRLLASSSPRARRPRSSATST